MRSFLKKNQELEYISVPLDSLEKPQKLAKLAQSDEEPAEAYSNRSGYKQSRPHDGGSDG